MNVDILDEADEKSFEIWLPAQEEYFFMKMRFLSPRDNNLTFGRCYINEPIHTNLQKNHSVTTDITSDNRIVGHCDIIMRFESSMETVKLELENNKELQLRYRNNQECKIKEYEYLQFLWGMRYKSPDKISQLDVPWMLVVRTLFVVLLGILGLVVHVYGRCEPLCLVIAVMMLRTREYVMLRTDRFTMTWLVLAAILLDVIWLVLASHHLSEINFFNLMVAQIITCVLIAIKAFLLIYLVFFEKSFEE